MLRAMGHQVVGLDSYLFEDCSFGPEIPHIPAVRRDIRDVQRSDLKGFDAIMHLVDCAARY
jgi:hypothetical protein